MDENVCSMASFTWPTFIDRWTVDVYVIHLWSVVVHQLICQPPPPPTKDHSSLGRFSVVNRCRAANISERFQCLNVNRPTTDIAYLWSDDCRPMVGLLSDDGRGLLDGVPNYFKGRNRSATQKIYTCNWPRWSHGWPTKGSRYQHKQRMMNCRLSSKLSH